MMHTEGKWQSEVNSIMQQLKFGCTPVTPGDLLSDDRSSGNTMVSQYQSKSVDYGRSMGDNKSNKLLRKHHCMVENVQAHKNK